MVQLYSWSGKAISAIAQHSSARPTKVRGHTGNMLAPWLVFAVSWAREGIDPRVTQLPSYGYLNVMAFGARADGTDDTNAFAAALKEAASLGGPVLVPAGTYTIRGTLEVPAGVALTGTNQYPFRSWGTPSAGPVGTTLLAYSGRGNASALPFIRIGPNGGVVGMNIYYPEQDPDQVPVAYPPCIQGSGDNIAVRNVLLVNPWFGVDFATFPCGRHLIDGLYGQPLSVGISVDQCYDIGRIKSIHFWPFWAPLKSAAHRWQHTHAVSLDLQRTDWEVVEDVFSFGYHVGLRLRKSVSGACNGQFSDINFDDVDIGIEAQDTQEFACIFSNLNVANAGDGLYKIGILGTDGGSAMVTVRGGSFWGDLNAAVVWQGSGMVRVSDSTVHAWNKSIPAIHVAAGRAMLMGNAFHDVTGTAVRIGPAADRVVVSSNELAGNTISVENKLALVANNHE